MASRVVGLDIGELSVKAVVLETALKTFELVEVVEEAIGPPPPAPGAAGDELPPDAETPAAGVEAIDEPDDEAQALGLKQRTLQALHRLAARGVFEADAIVTSAPLAETYLTQITLPFHGVREIEAVLVPQLEGRLPTEVDELHLDFMRGGLAPNGEHRVFAAGIAPARLAIALADLLESGVDPKIVDLSPFHLMTAGRALAPELDGPVAIVDIGAEQTAVVVYKGDELQYARSFSGGGERVTSALGDMFGLDPATARAGKHREGFIDQTAPDAKQPTGTDAVDIAAACRAATRPIVRQVRRTLHAHATESGEAVDRVYLCGGGALLPGLVEYMGLSLGVETSLLPLDADGLQTLPGFADVGHRFVTALGLALRATSAVKGSAFNFRHGEFSFKGSHEYLRSRVPQLAFGVVTLALLSLVFGLGRLSALGAEARAVDDAIGAMSEQVFGEAITDGGEVRRRFLRGSVRPGFLPDVTAGELFAEVANRVVDTQDLGYEVTWTEIEVDMERRIFVIEGQADSAESVDTFEVQLAEAECLRDISRNDLSQRHGREGFTFAVQGVATCEPPEEEEDR